MMPGRPVDLAVIGGGGIGWRHLEIAHGEPECGFVGLVDPDPAVRRRAEALGVPAFADLEGLMRGHRPEGAIVAVPTGLHLEVGLDCIGRGLPVLMEKPVAADVAAGRTLVAAAERAGVPLAVGHHRRFDPAVEATHAALRDGRLGRVLAVSVLWFVRKPDAYFEIPWRREKGAGPILTNLIHDLDLLRHFCGEVESVFAETAGEARGFAVEDSAALLLRFRGGTLGTVTLSDAAPSPWGWEQGSGDNPTVSASGADCYFFAGSEASLGFPSLTLWRQTGVAGEAGGWSDPFTSETLPSRERQALADQLRHFLAVVRGEAAPRVDGADALRTLAVCEAVFASAANGVAVVPEPGLLPD